MIPKCDFDEALVSNICYLSIPDCNIDEKDTIFTFRVCSERTKDGRPKKYLFGYVLYRQEKDDSLERGYLQKSVVLITRSNYVKLFTEVISIIGKAYFECGEKILETAAIDISKWSKPYYNCNLRLPLLGRVIDFYIPHIRNGAFIFSPYTSQSDGKYNITVDLYKPLKNILLKLTTLWELVLLNEPILVLSPNPTISCNSVLALVSLISPLEFKGDFRPFITIHDHDFKTFSEGNKNTSVIIGGTNPYFFKAFEDWPHILTINNEKDKDKTNSFPFEYKNHLKSKYKRLSKSDSSFLQRLKKKSIEDDSEIDYELKMYFYNKTEEFIKPLDDYFQTLLPTVYKFTPFGKLHDIKPFRKSSFLNYISKSYKQQKICDLDLYRKFLNTINFIGWYKQKKNNWREHIIKEYNRYIKTLNIKSYLKGKTECEIVDLIIKAKRQLTDPDLNNETLDIIKDFIEEMLTFVSPDIRKSLLKTKISV